MKVIKRFFFKAAIFTLPFLLVLLCVGCRPKADVSDSAAGEPVDLKTAVVGAKVLEDGRTVGGSARGKIGETLTNVFFSFCVDKVELLDEYEGQQPERNYVYLVSEVTIKSIAEEPIPMWSEDFLIQWGDGENDYAYPLAKFSDSQMDEEFTLSKEESITKVLVFEVPVPEEENEYNISYLEYYEDDTEGNTFYVIFSLSE